MGENVLERMERMILVKLLWTDFMREKEENRETD